jgi:hypothetical protein
VRIGKLKQETGSANSSFGSMVGKEEGEKAIDDKSNRTGNHCFHNKNKAAPPRLH